MFFIHCAINLWNLLPYDIAKAKNLIGFEVLNIEINNTICSYIREHKSL